MRYKRARALLSSYYKWWVRYLGLGFWTISLAITDNKTYKRYHSRTKDGVAVCEVDWKYCTASIVVNRKQLCRLTKQEIERVVVHELMHVFLNETRETGLDHEERVATMLTSGFMWVRDASRR